MFLKCAKCGAVYPGDLQRQWGRTAETSGHGGSPVCVALTPAVDAPPAPGGQVPVEVCRGMLGAVDDNASDRKKLLTLTAIAGSTR